MMDSFEAGKTDNFPYNVKQEESIDMMDLGNDPNLNDLVDLMSCPPDLMELSLSDIPLTDERNILELIPDEIPNDHLLLLKIPESLQNDELLEEMMDIDLDPSILDTIQEAIAGHDGALIANQEMPPIEINDEDIEFPIIRRQPLQVIQKIIKYPVAKHIKPGQPFGKKVHKRKQLFVFPREDLVEFYSDDDENTTVDEKLATPLDLDIKPDLPSLQLKTNELLEIVTDAVEKKIKSKAKSDTRKSNSKTENCPRCDKPFKRLMLHKCKLLVPADQTSKIQKLKPSDVPLPPQNCEICKQFFRDEKELNEHQMQKHSHLVCKLCKQVMKSAQVLKVHKLKCGLEIKAVEKKMKLRLPIKKHSKNKK